MAYVIDKSLWHTCKICGAKIGDLAKIYGGENIYYTQVFKQHLAKDHDNITLEKYFEEWCGLTRPICPCGVCNKHCNIRYRGSNFKWIEYACGRYPGQQEWSKKAKTTRRGKGNPMYGKKPWNKGLDQFCSESMRRSAEKQRGRKASLETKQKLSIAAKKRKVPGHLGHKHKPETIELLRKKTIENIKKGIFKQTKTKPHIEFCKILDNLNLKYKEEVNIKYWVFDIYLTDFDVYIEVDGDYFHSNPIVFPNGPKTKTQKVNYARDISKNKYCKDNNITLWRFWERDILNNPEHIKFEILCKLKEL